MNVWRWREGADARIARLEGVKARVAPIPVYSSPRRAAESGRRRV